MNITEASYETDAEKRHPIDSTEGNTESSCRQYVNELLDLSEEDYCREHNMHLFQSCNGWEDAVSQINTTDTELHLPLVTFDITVSFLSLSFVVNYTQAWELIV